VNKDGVPALHVAVLSGHADAVEALVDDGADVDVRGPTGGNTALHEAVLLGPSLSRVVDALLVYALNTHCIVQPAAIGPVDVGNLSALGRFLR